MPPTGRNRNGKQSEGVIGVAEIEGECGRFRTFVKAPVESSQPSLDKVIAIRCLTIERASTKMRKQSRMLSVAYREIKSNLTL